MTDAERARRTKQLIESRYHVGLETILAKLAARTAYLTEEQRARLHELAEDSR